MPDDDRRPKRRGFADEVAKAQESAEAKQWMASRRQHEQEMIRVREIAEAQAIKHNAIQTEPISELTAQK